MTDKNEFTPGPWELWKERKTGERIILGNSVAVCDVHPGPTRDADARLIAKAPEMRLSLEILADTIQELLEAGRIIFNQDDAPHLHGDLEVARALLSEIDGYRCPHGAESPCYLCRDGKVDA